MKNKALLFTLIIILTLAGAAVIYVRYYQKPKLNIWNIIPAQAVSVFEPGNCTSCRNELTSHPLWKFFDALLFHHYSPNEITGQLVRNIVREEGWMVSLHITRKNDFDFVFYWQARADLSGWFPSQGVRITERVYQRIPITEYRWGDYVFSVITLENIQAGSLTPYLVEDVIRTWASDGQQSFASVAAPLASIPRVQRDAGNLFINMPAVVGWLNCFPEHAVDMSSAGTVAAFDIRQTPAAITLNGFTLHGGKEDYLHTFELQQPVSFSQKSLISERSLVVFHQGITNGRDFYTARYRAQQTALDSLAGLSGMDFPAVYEKLGQEISVCMLEEPRKPFTKVVLFDAADATVWFDLLDRLSKAAEREDTLYAENYGEYQLREIKIPDVPARLFGSLAQGFERTYFTKINKTFVLAPAPATLKQFLDDIDREQVVGKSLDFNQFLETTLLESSFSIYVNLSELSELLLPRLAQPWQEWYRKRRPDLTLPGFSSLQFSHLNNSFYTQLSFTTIAGKKSALATQAARIQTRLPAGLYPFVYLAENHATRRYDVVVQDSSGVLHYLTDEGKLLWSLPVKDKVLFADRQIDFFSNGKLQLVFATPGMLHVVDRLGNYVNPFPVRIPAQRPEFFEVVDYDNSKRYRFLITDEEGNIWMFDKQGQNLDGWKPRSAGGKLSAPARHYRIHGRDYLVAVRLDGQVMVYNRRGELLKGFPLNLDARPAGDIYVETGTGRSGTVFICVSRDGIKTGFTADGKIVVREPLIKTTITDRFWLVSEANRKGYIIARQGPASLSLLDEAGKEILINDFTGGNAVLVKYYNMGAGKLYYVITDLHQDLTYLYDASGSLITASPLPSSATVLSKNGNPQIIAVDERALVIENR